MDTPERRRLALIVAGVTGVLAIATGEVVILLWAAALGAVAVAATVWARTAGTALEIDAAFEPPRAFAGEDVRVRLTLANRKRLGLPIVRVLVRFPPGLLPAEDLDPTALRGHRVRLTLGGGSEITLRLPVVARTRGEYWLDDLEVEVADPFDLVPVKREIAVERPLLVMPEPRSGVPLRIVRRLPFGSPAAAARLFEDREHFAGVREYEPGDPMRQVHWRLTAHSGHLQTKRFEPTRSAEVLFAVDVANGEPFWHGVDPETAEETIGWASYLARQAIHAGWRTGLIANTHFRRGHGRLRVPPATKVGAEAALFAALARMPNQPTTDLGPVLREHGRRLVDRTTVIVISPDPGPSLRQAMDVLRRRGSEVILVSPPGGVGGGGVVMASAHRAVPSGDELRACGLAALAEAGLVYLPVHYLLSQGRAIDLDVELLAVPFVAAYVVGALLACRFRTSRNLPFAAAIVATLAGVTLASGGIERVAFAVVVAMLVGLRIVTLGLRDWRTPLHAELGWGAAALGAEAIAAAGPMPEWRPLLLAFVPIFFAAGLGSRATTVWASSGEQDARAAEPWVRRTLAAVGGLGAVMVLAVVLAVRGGVLDVVGRWLRPVLAVVEAAFFFVVVQAARPLFWLADQLNIDPERFREALARLRRSVGQARNQTELHPLGASPWQRIVGLMVFVAIGYGIYRLLHRAQPQEAFDRRSREPGVGETEVAAVVLDPPPRWRFRPELPAEAVRRLYAETLLDLRGRSLSKEPSLTPAEFAPQVAAAFPEGAEDFRALTRAYEDVRYGGLRLGRDRVRDLEVRQRRLLALLRTRGSGPVG